MLKINDIINIKIEKIVNGGEGLGYYNGKVVFVPFSVPGDELKIKIISSKKDYSRGLINEILVPSNSRIKPKCIYFEKCGGCDFMMIDYDKQIEYKKNIINENILKFSKNEFKCLDYLEMENPYSRYHHNSYEDNGDAHLKRSIMGREVVVAITNGKLDFGPWEQIFYGEFDGKRKKRILVKIIGE